MRIRPRRLAVTVLVGATTGLLFATTVFELFPAVGVAAVVLTGVVSSALAPTGYRLMVGVSAPGTAMLAGMLGPELGMQIAKRIGATNDGVLIVAAGVTAGILVIGLAIVHGSTPWPLGN